MEGLLAKLDADCYGIYRQSYRTTLWITLLKWWRLCGMNAQTEKERKIVARNTVNLAEDKRVFLASKLLIGVHVGL